MNKRAIVNVATGEFYCKMQERLQKSFSSCVDKVHTVHADSVGLITSFDLRYSNKKGIDLLLWKGLFPIGSRSHDTSPYGFKIHAIKAAYEMGYTSILWLDSPAYAVKEDISPIFNKIEKEGYYAMSHIDPLENWVGDEARNYWDVSDGDLSGLNLPSGSCYGVSTLKMHGLNVFADMLTLEKAGMFKSNSTYHRHDETILAMILKGYGLKVFTHDPLFQSDSPECVIRSGTAWAEDAKVYGDKYNQ